MSPWTRAGVCQLNPNGPGAQNHLKFCSTQSKPMDQLLQIKETSPFLRSRQPLTHTKIRDKKCVCAYKTHNSDFLTKSSSFAANNKSDNIGPLFICSKTDEKASHQERYLNVASCPPFQNFSCTGPKIRLNQGEKDQDSSLLLLQLARC